MEGGAVGLAWQHQQHAARPWLAPGVFRTGTGTGTHVADATTYTYVCIHGGGANCVRRPHPRPWQRLTYLASLLGGHADADADTEREQRQYCNPPGLASQTLSQARPLSAPYFRRTWARCRVVRRLSIDRHAASSSTVHHAHTAALEATSTATTTSTSTSNHGCACWPHGSGSAGASRKAPWCVTWAAALEPLDP